jgi:hypothetical protein
MMTRKRWVAGAGSVALLGTVLALLLVFAFAGSSGDREAHSKFAVDPDAAASSTGADRYAEGPASGYEAYLSAERTYPADVIPTSVVANARATFDRIAKQGDPNGNNHWQAFGPLQNSIEPGVLSFTGATSPTASRDTALVIAPTCVPGNCRLWVGTSGGGVWRTDDALAADPSWTWLTPQVGLNSVGALVADPNDPSGNTLYLGTGEGNRCSSGCEAGVGIYKSTDGGNSWAKLADSCVDNSTYACNNSGDAFLGRGVNKIVIDPTNPNHIFVGSALAVRGLSHVIGNGGTTRLEPDANPVGLYESTDGGNTFTEVWDADASVLGTAGTFGVTDVGLDPRDPTTVYASAFDAGVWRRSPSLDATSSATAFSQVFAPQFKGGGTDRTMFALTTKNGKTRIYLVDGTANSGGPAGANAGNFWRTDNAGQTAAALLATQAAGGTVPPGSGNPFPAVYNGWQLLTAKTTASPYYATTDTCTGQCWYDEDVYTPAGLPDTVYVIGSYNYGELPCNTKGVGCGNGRSDGRAVLYSTTAGDPDASLTGAGMNRTFTDLTFDTQSDPSATWCSLGADGELAFGGVKAPYACLWAPNGIHPDQHAIIVNPSNPTQIFEGSDGGVIRTTGDFGDLSSRCNSNERPLLGAASLRDCGRLLSRVPTTLTHIDRNLNTLQFINVAINPQNPCEVQGGTQDNGTWSNNNPTCDQNTWPQVIYGDGGNAGYDGTNPTWRFNEFTSAFTDANFENGAPTKWVIISAPLVNSHEAVGFYWPEIGDPNPATGTHPIYSGLQHVWRSWAFGAGDPTHTNPQDTTPNIAGYEANCPEFTTGGDQVGCGDFQPMGGDLTSETFGSDRTGGSISWLARDVADHGTLWAATSAGRIFVTHNADAQSPADVTWHRIDNATSPTRFPSSIYPDPNDPTHAWISYTGYNAATPTTPGHVFDVTEGGPAAGSGTFTNLNVESGTSAFPTPTNNGDLPVTDIVRDDAKKKLYVATDFGVLRGDNDGKSWHVTSGLPRFEVTHLEIQPSARVPTCVGLAKKDCPTVIYAATHSQGIWKLDLGGK